MTARSRNHQTSLLGLLDEPEAFPDEPLFGLEERDQLAAIASQQTDHDRAAVRELKES